MQFHIIPDDIQSIDNAAPEQQIRTIHEYIKYLREQIDFWASRRNAEIQALQTENAALKQSLASTQYRAGDTLSGTFYGYGYTTGSSGHAYIQFCTTKPIAVPNLTIRTGTGIYVRGISGVMASGELADLDVVDILRNPSGFRIHLQNLTNWVTQTPVAMVGTFSISLSN